MVKKLIWDVFQLSANTRLFSYGLRGRKECAEESITADFSFLLCIYVLVPITLSDHQVYVSALQLFLGLDDRSYTGLLEKTQTDFEVPDLCLDFSQE